MLFHYLDLAWRSLKKTPSTSLLMVLAIAMGIGITMTSLSVYHMMSVNPIPDKSQQLFAVQLRSFDNAIEDWNSLGNNMPVQLTYIDVMNLRQSTIPARQAGMFLTGFVVHNPETDSKPLLESARVTDSDFFAMFDITFLHGGAWDKKIDQQSAPVIVIGEQLNNRLFGGGNNVGKNILLEQEPYRIVGIIKDWSPSPKYYDLNNGSFRDSEQIYIPFSLTPIKEFVSWGNNRGWKLEQINSIADKLQSEKLWIQYWVELNDRQQRDHYQEFLNNYIKQQQKVGRFQHDQPTATVKNVGDWLAYRQVVSEDNKILVGLSFMFLAVCLINTLGLLLAKFLKRSPEIGVRRALGASKWQIFQQHLVEVFLLGLAGGLLGLVIAQLGLFALRSGYDQYHNLAQMDWLMYLAAPVIAITASVIAGIYPAWRVCRTAPAIYLKTE